MGCGWWWRAASGGALQGGKGFPKTQLLGSLRYLFALARRAGLLLAMRQHTQLGSEKQFLSRSVKHALVAPEADLVSKLGEGLDSF